MYQRILVPIDGSATGALGLQEAMRLAHNLGARIRLIHVITRTPWVTEGSPSAIEEQLNQFRSTGESIVHAGETAVRSAGIEVDDRLIEACGERAGKFVVAEAVSWPAELIVCGTHGMRGLTRLLMGSDAEYIVSHSPVPVLLVRGPPAS